MHVKSMRTQPRYALFTAISSAENCPSPWLLCLYMERVISCVVAPYLIKFLPGLLPGLAAVAPKKSTVVKLQCMQYSVEVHEYMSIVRYCGRSRQMRVRFCHARTHLEDKPSTPFAQSCGCRQSSEKRLPIDWFVPTMAKRFPALAQLPSSRCFVAHRYLDSALNLGCRAP